MKKLGIVLVPLLIVTFLIISISCNGEETTPTPTPTAVPTSTPGEIIDSAIAAFTKIPVEWGRARYINLATFQEDPDLIPFYEDCYEAVGHNLSGIGIDLNEIDSTSFVVKRAAIYSGRLDFTYIAEVLKSAHYVQSTYLDTEIWESRESGGEFITLLPPNSVLVTLTRQDAEMCISVVKKWGDSIYTDSNVRDVISRLPSPLLRVDIEKDEASGPLAIGSTVERLENTALRMATIAKFQDDASAKKGLSDAETQFNSWANSWNMMNVENVQIRRFVKSTGTADISDVLNPLAPYETYWLY